MFLPVLLVRDFGAWGFVVFALPNVAGAAAMGFVLARAGASERLVESHAPAMRGFSGVTIAFHGYLLGWLATRADWRLLAVGAVLAVLAATDARRRRMLLDGVLGTTISSALAAGLFFGRGAGWTGPGASELGVGPPIGLVWLALPCALGFALCPYLDRTFHAARQALLAGEARAAFALGFGVVFLAMIVFTLGYSGYVLDRLSAQSALLGVGSIALLMHLVGQSVFTVRAHMLADVGGVLDRGAGVGLVAFGAALGLGAALAPLVLAGMSSAEVGYRLFMGCYGLAFPAYVWLAMLPTGDGHAGFGGPRGRVKRRVWAAAVGVAAPMYWMGFVAGHEPWLGPGVAVVLLARVFVGRGFGRHVPSGASPGRGDPGGSATP